jgi:hypothetical protein
VRAPASRIVRVWPGDQVVVRARLKGPASLARLYVFAREVVSEEFSPYVPTIDLGGAPVMQSPLMLRLTSENPSRTIGFEVDVDGYIRVVQEIDRPTDQCAQVRIKRVAAPSTSWLAAIGRKIVELVSWPMLKLS